MKPIKQEHSTIASDLTASKNRLSRARVKAEREWDAHKELIKDAYDKGLSLDQIAGLTEVTKSRIWQLVTGRKK